jgi:hypothetical protein
VGAILPIEFQEPETYNPESCSREMIFSDIAVSLFRASSLTKGKGRK